MENEAARRKGKKGAVGLIQFTPSVGIPSLNDFLATKAGRAHAQALGIAARSVTRDGLLRMTPMEQMRYVVLYFRIPVNALPAGATYDKIYQKILAPGRNGDMWYTQGTKNYADNRQFDTDRDGKITRLEAAAVLRDRGMVVNYFAPAAGSSSGQPTTEAVTSSVRPATPAKPSPRPTAPPVRSTPTPVAQTVTPAQARPQMDPQGTYDDRITQALTAFTQSYRFPVVLHWMEDEQVREKTIQVQTPYYINAGSIQRSVQTNRSGMPAADRAIYQQMPSTVRTGKASPEEMHAAARLVAQRNPFGVHPHEITGAMLTAWLKRYGLGVDCSDFVTQALDYSTTQASGKDPHLGDAGVRINRASGTLNKNHKDFQAVATPAQVRPGDTMWLSGHIRIVLQVGPGPGGKGIQMMIAESTPNTQLPEARQHGVQSLTGVDRAIWWFTNENRFSTKGLKKKVASYNWEALPTDQWEVPNTWREETLVFSRYKPLAQGREP